MNKDLILERGTLFKKAQGQPGQGPSFEQQFGILANAQITDKYPALSQFKVAFQMLDKDDDNTYAAGAAVYQLGKSFVYIPAVFRNGKISTGQMMYVNNMQRFLPLSDAWMSYVKNKDVAQSGDLIPAELGTDIAASPGQAQAKDVTDPITKTAAQEKVNYYNILRGISDDADPAKKKAVEKYKRLTRHGLPAAQAKQQVLDEDGVTINQLDQKGNYKNIKSTVTKKASLTKWASLRDLTGLQSPGPEKTSNVLLDALKLGKKASACMLDMLNNNDYINAALQHYGPQAIGQFAKTAAAIFKDPIKPYIVSVLDKQASTLTDSQKEQLYRDGYIIKTAAERISTGNATDVINSTDVKTLSAQFTGVTNSCKCQLLTEGGDLDDVTIIRAPSLCECGADLCSGDYVPNKYAGGFGRNNDIPAKKPQSKDLYVIVDGKAQRLSGEVPQALVTSIKDVDYNGIGTKLSSKDKLEWDSIIVTPNGTCFSLNDSFEKAQDGTFFSYSQVLKEAEEDDLVQPMHWKSSIIVPKGSRVVQPAKTKQKRPINYVVTSTLGASLNKFVMKQYKKLKVYSNGSEVMVSGNKSKDEYMNQKTAALHLVTDYNIEPAIAKHLVKTAVAQSQIQPKATTYLIKTAVEGDSPMWEDSDIGMSQIENPNVPNIDKTTLDGYAQDPAQVMQAIENATNSGIKEVFDMQTLKLLIQTADPIQEISEVIPDFMNTLDKICRLLFLYRCHTTDMEQQYGTVKMKALEQSLQNTLKDLSQLTVFLKLRGLNNTPDNNPDMGELQTGSML